MSGYNTELAKLETNRNCLRRIARHDEQNFSKDSIVNVMERFVKTVNIMDDTILVPCRLMDRQIGDSTDILPAATGKDTTANQLTAQGKRGAAHSKNVQDFLSASELFNLYNMLNALKKDLLWTANQEESDEVDQQEPLKTSNPLAAAPVELEIKTESNTQQQPQQQSSIKGHVRRISTASMVSTTSVSNMSDSDSDISAENDSGLESDGNKSDNAPCSDGSSSSSSSEIDACKSKSKQANADKATELAKRCRRHLNGLYQCLEQMTEAANYLTARYQSDIGPV